VFALRRETERKGMKRRHATLALVLLGAAWASPAAFADQQGKVWRVGVLLPAGPPTTSLSPEAAALHRGLRELGYAEGKNLQVAWRYAGGQYDRFAGLAAELVQWKVDVIVTGGPTATGAAQKVTSTVPIVMANSDDAVESGFVSSLAHPGGNITGLSNISGELGPKQLELLLGVAPGLSRVAVLVNPANASSMRMVLKPLQSAAQTKGVRTLPAEARTSQEIETAFARIVKEKAEAVIVVQDALFSQQRGRLAELATRHRLPTIGRDPGYAGAGGLMSYGPNALDNFRRVAIYIDKIFKGASPGDLPVEQPTKFDLIINSRTARTLGLAMPPSILLRAEQVID
jgi:putative ABC transport system substrate-binding protein